MANFKETIKNSKVVKLAKANWKAWLVGFGTGAAGAGITAAVLNHNRKANLPEEQETLEEGDDVFPLTEEECINVLNAAIEEKMAKEE